MQQVRAVNIADYFDAAIPLMREHWQEAGFAFPFNPSKERYVGMQQSGLGFALAAFDGDDLVGYSTAVVVPHWFNPAVRFCCTDALYMAKRYRGTLLAGRLIHATEHEAKLRGAHFVSWHTRAGTPLAVMLGAHKGYEPWDIVVMKGL